MKKQAEKKEAKAGAEEMGLSSFNFENRPRAGETKTPGWGQQQPELRERSAEDREQLPGEA